MDMIPPMSHTQTLSSVLRLCAAAYAISSCSCRVAGGAAVPARTASSSAVPGAATGASPGPAPIAAQKAGALDAAARQQVLEELARRLDAEYIDPAVGRRLATFVREQLEANAYKAFSDPEAFAEELTRDLQRLSDDQHLNLFWSEEPIPPPLGDSPAPELLEPLKKWTGGIRELQVLDGNIGYMKLVNLAARPAAEEAIAAAFAFLHHTDALIIDNRENHGGDPRTAMLYLSYLVDRAPFVVLRKVGRDGAVLEELGTIELGDRRYGAHKPVYVLLSRGSFSGGAGLAYQLRLLGRAVLIGEPATRGKGFPRAMALGHGVYAWVPYARGVSAIAPPGSGGDPVKPDIAVPAAQALAEARSAAQRALQAPRNR
jgi:retinol-binding protein 3